MASPKKQPVADPYANMPEPSAQDPYADMPDAFAAAPDNKAGTYQMQTPEGALISVPYPKVMDAAKSGYKISPDDRIRFGTDKVYELSGKGLKGKFNPDTDLPQPFNEMKPSAPWYKPTVKGTERKVLDLLPTAGAAGLGLLAGGPGLATGPGDIVIASGAAGIGAAGGEAARQAISDKVFPFDTRLTPKESAKAIGVQAAYGALSEAGGRTLGLAVNPAMKHFGKTALASEKAGIHLLPSEAAGKAPSYLEKLAKGSVISRATLERFRVEQNAESKLAVDKLANKISNFRGTPEELGEVVQKGIDEHKEAFRSLQNKVYDDIAKDVNERIKVVPVTTTEQVPTGLLDQYGKPTYTTVKHTTLHDEVVDDVMPSTANLKAFAKKALTQIEQQEKIMDPTLLSKSKGLLQTILNSPDRVPFNVMKDSRSDYLAISRQFDQALEGKAAGFAKKMSQLYDESMIDAAEKSKIPGLVDKIRSANAITANEHEMFEMPLIKKIVDTKNPETIATIIRRPTFGNQETRDLFTILPQKLHDPVRRQILEDTMRLSTDANTKAFSERGFAQKIGKLGDERGEIIFGPNWKNVKELTEILSKINGPAGLEGGGSGAAFQNIATIKNILSLAGGAVGGAAGAFSGGPGGAALGSVAGLAAGRGVDLLGELVAYKTLASVLTNPQLATKFLKAAHALIRIAPYATTATINETGGMQKGINRVKEEAQQLQDKLKNATTPAPAAPVPQVQFAPDGSVIHSEGTGLSQ